VRTKKIPRIGIKRILRKILDESLIKKLYQIFCDFKKIFVVFR